MEQIKIGDLSNSCCLVALKEVSDKSDQEVYDVCKAHGYHPKSGMRVYEYVKAMEKLGLKVHEVQIETKGREVGDKWIFGVLYCGVDRTARPTVSQFIKDHPEGTYVVATRTHAFVIRDGLVIDPNVRRRGMRRTLTHAHRVLNPVEKTMKFVEPITKSGPRYENPRYRSMVEFCHSQGTQWGYVSEITPELIFEKTTYRRCDLNYDLKVGHVRMHSESKLRGK